MEQLTFIWTILCSKIRILPRWEKSAAQHQQLSPAFVPYLSYLRLGRCWAL